MSIHLSCARQVKETVSPAVLTGLIVLAEVPSSNEAFQGGCRPVLSKRSSLCVDGPIATQWVHPQLLVQSSDLTFDYNLMWREGEL